MRAPVGPPSSTAVCLFCAHRLRPARTTILLQHASSRRIQTTHSARRPAQATANVRVDQEEDGAQRQEVKAQRSLGSEYRRPRPSLRPSLPARNGEASTRSQGASSSQERTAFRHQQPQGSLIRRVDHDGGVGLPIFKPAGSTSGLQRRREAQPQVWKHINRNEGQGPQSAFQPRSQWDAPQDTARRTPDPWSLNIPSNRPAGGMFSPRDSAPAYDVRESYARAAKERPAGSFDQAARQRNRWEQPDRVDRFRRTSDRQGPKNNNRFRPWSQPEEEDMDAAKVDRIDAKRKRKEMRNKQPQMAKPTPILLPDYIRVGNLANALRVSATAFTKKLKRLGFDDVSVDHVIDAETAGLVAAEFNFEPTLPGQDVEEDIVALPEPADKSELVNRPPVVTIMGHVDHGKTTLLDWLRKSSVVASEHGGITQHIGAFTVPMPSGRVITFLDTPGHAAFLDMRARGANVTDIVILVVAADDSVKPQTLEAIKHAKAAKVPMIVAINKIDKEDADAQKVKMDLARHGVEVEDFGGDVQTVQVSGKTGQGMEDLEEATLALADILDVRAPTDGVVEGRVIESSAGKAGKVATVLVRRGTLSPGAVLVAGKTWSRVRSLHDANGAVVESAGPGVPVVVDGWREQPDAGDEVLQAAGEQRAKRAIEYRMDQADNERMAADVSSLNQTRTEEAALAAAEAKRDTDDDAATRAEAAAHKDREASSNVLELPLVLRGDVSGSVEALDASIQALSSPLIKPVTLRALVGPATPSDLFLAELTGGALVSFNIDVPNAIAHKAERARVPVISGNVIYRLVDAVKGAMEDRLPEKIGRRVLGEAVVLEIFQISLGGGKGKLAVAGVRVGNGLLKQGGRVRVLRGGKADADASDLGAGRKGARRSTAAKAEAEEEHVVFDGHIASLRSHKKEVQEMRKGSECGVSFDAGFDGFLSGDRVQLYEETREKQKIMSG